jgi:hypothetical protein
MEVVRPVTESPVLHLNIMKVKRNYAMQRLSSLYMVSVCAVSTVHRVLTVFASLAPPYLIYLSVAL